MANNTYLQYGQINQYFPQPQGNVYMINNSMELANIPVSGNLTVALCPSESLMYLKSLQNGMPTVISYTLSINDGNQRNTFEDRFNALEAQIDALKKMWEGE